jgi:hypothetical protein
MDYMRQQDRKFSMTKEDFREGLKLATNGDVFYERRTRDPDKGKRVFQGLTFGNDDVLTDAAGKIIKFPNR